MNREQAIKKIEELKRFVRECEVEETTTHKLKFNKVLLSQGWVDDHSTEKEFASLTEIPYSINKKTQYTPHMRVFIGERHTGTYMVVGIE